jgi:predicted branched-subunit amino acid permease
MAANTITGARRQALLGGARAMLPWLAGLLPNALVIGVYSSRSDLPTLAGWLTGPLIFTASAQMALLQLLDGGAAPAVVVAVVLAVNLRLVLYSATMATHWQGTPRLWRAFAAHFLVDPVAVVGSEGYGRMRDRTSGHLHYLGASLALWIGWSTAIGLGALAGSRIPASLRLEFVVPLFLVGQLTPRLSNRAARCGALVAAGAGAVGSVVPLHLGAVLAMAVGVAVALVSGTAGGDEATQPGEAR